MISKAQVALGAIILVVVTAAVSAFVFSNWEPFPPKDYEDCAARAAKNAKSKDALSVLVSICGSEFKGRRKPGGGYTYYDEPCTDLGAFVIKGPNPTPTEMSDINQRCLTHLEALQEIEAEQAEQKRRAQQAAQEAKAATAQRRRLRALSAMTDVHVKAVEWVGVECSLFCSEFVKLRVEVINRSMEALSTVFIGLAFVQSISCPSSYVEKTRLNLPLSPGETRTATIDFIDRSLSKSRVCTKVVDVWLAGD